MFDSSNEAPGRTDYKATNINSLWCTLAEKNLKKTSKNDNFFEKRSVFEVFLDFSSAKAHHKELKFLVLLLVRPGASFELSNTQIERFLFFGL